MANSTRPRTTAFVLGIAVAIAASVLLKPKPMYTDKSPPPLRLAQAIPEHFGGWTLAPQQGVIIVSPEVKAMLENLYSDTLSRTYVNADGDQVMLSLAYGADQSRALQVHRPEICYGPQGFKLTSPAAGFTPTVQGALPVTRILATKGPRSEPITYWIRTGDYIISGWFEQNFARIKAGMAGHYPDGILVRISTIDGDTEHAYAVQNAFIKDMINALPPDSQKLLLGARFLTSKSTP